MASVSSSEDLQSGGRSWELEGQAQGSPGEAQPREVGWDSWLAVDLGHVGQLVPKPWFPVAPWCLEVEVVTLVSGQAFAPRVTTTTTLGNLLRPCMELRSHTQLLWAVKLGDPVSTCIVFSL